MEAVVLPIIGLLIIITLMILFYSKQHVINAETKIYSKMIVLSFLFVVIGLITFIVAKITNNFILISLFQKIYMSFLVLLDYFSIDYCLMLFKKENELSTIRLPLIITTTVSILLVFVLPLNVIFYDNVLDGYGASYNIATTYCVICFVFFIVLTIYLLLKKQSIKKLLPFIILVILYIIGFILRRVYHELIFEGFFYAYILLIMYFTIENPDIKMVDELIKNRKIIERTSEEKAVFLFKMSQELKEPINNISTQIQNYRNKKLNKSEINLLIDNIDNNNRKMTYLITDVLGINAIDNKNIKILENTYNIYSLINEIEMRTRKMLVKDIDLNFTCAENIPKELYGDSLKLKQVLMSVIMNSIENTNKGYIHVDVNSLTKFDVCRLVISIKDSGCGIDLLTINEILDQDIEVSDKEYLKLDELDVDLKIAYKIIKLLNGTMYIKSDINKGTEVIITLNQYIKDNEDDNEDDKNNSLLEAYTRTWAHSKKVLIIDDDVNELKLIRTKLENGDYEVYTSLFGEDCIERIKKNEKYDLILIDDDMKLTSGISLLKELNILGNDSKKIVLLEKEKVSIGHHYIKDGFDNFIDKSNLKDEIDRKIINN